jgi:diguanylate cyclase (GGDEF)-like protein/PAS domain S-box-containing protein
MSETAETPAGLPVELQSLVAALRENDDRYRALAGQATDGVLFVSADGRIVDASPGAAALLGRRRSALLALSLADVVEPEAASDVPAEILALRPGQRLNRVLHLRRAAGRLEAEASGRRLADGRVHLALRDLGERRRAAAALRESEARYEAAAAGAREALVLEAAGRIVFANLSWRRLLGLLPSARLAGRTLADFVHPDERAAVAAAAAGVATGGEDAALATRLVRTDGSTAEVEGTATRVAYGGRPTVQLVLREVFPTSAVAPTGLFRDPVTGLTGPALVPDRLSVAIAQAYRHRARVGVVHVDLDRFARTESRLGRPLGDRLLRAAARRLSQCVRQGDTAARLEGHSFALVLPGLHHREDATRIAEKVLRALRKPFPLAEGAVTLTGSAGIAVFPEDGEDAPALLACATDACRRAADGGGDRLEASEPPAFEGFDPVELEANLRAALAGCRVEIGDDAAPAGLLYYQPIRGLADGRTVGVEALLRWQHPQLGLAFPQSFLSKSDFTGLILAIGPWILRTAARQGREWLLANDKLRVAVNLSPPELSRRGLADDVHAVLVETGLPARRLQLEVPEGHVVSDLPRSLDVLHRLKALGITLMLDRVAVRYSSLGHLAELPVDGIKLDLSFLRGHGSRAEDVSLVSALTAVARGLKLRVAAQGVESAEQLAMLRRLGCTEAQGFHLGAPMPATRFLQELEKEAAGKRGRSHVAGEEGAAGKPHAAGAGA